MLLLLSCLIFQEVIITQDENSMPSQGNRKSHILKPALILLLTNFHLFSFSVQLSLIFYQFVICPCSLAMCLTTGYHKKWGLADHENITSSQNTMWLDEKAMLTLCIWFQGLCAWWANILESPPLKFQCMSSQHVNTSHSGEIYNVDPMLMSTIPGN